MNKNSTKAEILDALRRTEEELKRLKAERAKGGSPDIIKALLAIIQASCADHCPHHAAPEACKNCSIAQRRDEAMEGMEL